MLLDESHEKVPTYMNTKAVRSELHTVSLCFSLSPFENTISKLSLALGSQQIYKRLLPFLLNNLFLF